MSGRRHLGTLSAKLPNRVHRKSRGTGRLTGPISCCSDKQHSVLNQHAPTMSAEGLRRPVIISLSVVAAAATTYLLYQTLVASGEEASQALHRSNAIRRPRRRRAQPNLQSTGGEGINNEDGVLRTGDDRGSRSRPIDIAISNLVAAQHHPSVTFGRYRNDALLPSPGISPEMLDMNPTMLGELFRHVCAAHPALTPDQSRSLRQHLDASFVRQIVRTYWEEEDDFPDMSDRFQLEAILPRFGIDRNLVRIVIFSMRMTDPPLTEHWDLDTPYYSGTFVEVPPLMPETIDDDPMSIDSPNAELEDQGSDEKGHNMLNLLYHIAQEQAKKNGYVHRGVECNSCGACPIQGVRYHCANCFDFDLCETCESNGVHIKTHVFYKIRIPAPPRGQIKQVIPKWYPGNPNAFPQNLPKPLMDQLKDETGMDNPDIQGLYDQYKCLAGHEHLSDPAHLGMAMDRKAFDMYFIPIPSERTTPANLIYDRIFAFYDANDDGLIDFMEFVRGITRLNDKSFMARLRRLFQGYDLDGDGYVSRRDFLRMLRAYYDLNTQLSREMIQRNDDMDLDDEIRDTVQGTNPISAAFGGSMLFGHLSRPGQDKGTGADGDLDLINPLDGVLQDDLEVTADRNRSIGDVATGSRSRHHPFRSFRADPDRDEQLMQLANPNNVEVLAIQHADDASEAELTGPEPPFHTYGWPPLLTPESQDVITSLHADIPIEDITDPVDRSRVVYAQSQRLDAESDNLDAHKRQQAVNERWRRRQFYLDEEEGMRRPAGYAEPDSSDDESDHSPEMVDSPRRHSLRSRSSSKVRFDDSAIDTDYETRSNASSRSVPQNERWGGYELSRPTTDVGADILYGAVQQGFNELLDCLFRAKEDLAFEAIATRGQRTIWKKELDHYSINHGTDEEEAKPPPVQIHKPRLEDVLQAVSEDPELFQLNFDGSDADSPRARQAATEIQAQINEAINNVNAASALSRDVTPDPPRAPAPPTIDEAAEFRDLTLPQFRPDSANGDPPTSSPVLAPKPSPPSKPMLARWLRHRRIEHQARLRGGHGRLSFTEFRQLVEAQTQKDKPADLHRRSNEEGDDQGEDSGPASSGIADRSPRTPEQIVSGAAHGGDNDDEERDAAYWERSADLGRLNFLATWLEMAGF